MEPHVDPAEELEALFVPRSSVEKLHEAMLELKDVDPGDAVQAGALALLGVVTPALFTFIPNDPAELDELLLAGAKWALGMRSDHAWQPETINDLFGLGDDEDAS